DVLLFLLFHFVLCHRDLPSFPTRRSSDLPGAPAARWLPPSAWEAGCRARCDSGLPRSGRRAGRWSRRPAAADVGPRGFSPASWRSEEHTSELQSREKLVCRLLLERKNAVD